MKKRKEEYLFLFVILIPLLLGGLFLFIRDKYFNSVIEEKKEVISNHGFMLNKTDYYVALDSQIVLDISNEEKVEYEIHIENPEIVSFSENTLKAINTGMTHFSITINGFQCFSGRIYVVKGIVIPETSFNKKKPFISCNIFSKEENDILDKTLEDRLNAAIYQTRASVVAAARFLTLEFSYRIPYFYENGRLNNYGEGKKVDGEGRYYHKGLYLNSSRYEQITKKFTGPGAWGCKITQYQDAPNYNFVPRLKYPNGLDCSGFISWVLLNGGFDVKDSGAGDNIARSDDLYDLGEKNSISNSLLDSGKVKVGDLIAYSGHMAIIAGIDEEGNYYIAESLPQYKGVVLNKYNKSKLKATFTHIMLMDSVYQNDGNLTNMWY